MTFWCASGAYLWHSGAASVGNGVRGVREYDVRRRALDTLRTGQMDRSWVRKTLARIAAAVRGVRGHVMRRTSWRGETCRGNARRDYWPVGVLPARGVQAQRHWRRLWFHPSPTAPGRLVGAEGP